MTRERIAVDLAATADLLTGFPFKSSNYCGRAEGIRLVRGDNIIQRGIRWDGVKHWPVASADEFAKYRLEPGDVVLAMDRPWIEAGLKVAEIRPRDVPSLLVQRVARLRTKDLRLRQDFLKWLLYTPDFTQHVLSVQTGTAVPHISGSQILSFKFDLPEPDEQRRIAGVLGAFDDLIDTNLATVETILNLSRMLFNDVTREDVTEARLSDVASVNLDKVTPGPPHEALRYLDIAGLSDAGFSVPNESVWADAPSRARRGVQRGDTLWAMVRPNRRGHALLTHKPDKLVISTGIATLRPTRIGPAFLFASTDTERFSDYLTQRAEGSAYPAVRARDFEEAVIPIPSSRVVEEFEQVMWPLWEAAGELMTEATELERVRDELLPILLSGRVSVDEAWGAVPA